MPIKIAKIPITAITGFLGSGKTTLLNYILENNYGLRIGVVVNDYGSINIDSRLIAGRTDKTLELTNGCMCCSLSSLELDEAISQFAYPGSPIDYIIIEASGLAEPADLASTLRNATGRHTKLDSIVALLDAYNLERNAGEHDTAIRQIEHSDFVIINKTDLVTRTKVQDIISLITMMNPRARYFIAVRAAVDVRLLLGQDLQKETTPDIKSHRHIHEEYQSVSFETEKPFEPMKFQTFVNQIIPPAIYRAKGIVNLGNKGHRRKYIFQLVGKRADITWGDWTGEKPRTELVFIGKDFDRAKLLEQIEACVDPEPSKHQEDYEVVLPKREL